MNPFRNENAASSNTAEYFPASPYAATVVAPADRIDARDAAPRYEDD
jgi:hypothetical protein